MALFLGILIFSFIINSVVIVPFINLLYRLKFTYHQPIPSLTKLEKAAHYRLQVNQKWKYGTPVGGGILIIFISCLLYFILYPFINRFGVNIISAFPIKEELNVLFFTFVSFGLIGLYDDIKKTFRTFDKNIQTTGLPGKKNIYILGLSFLISLILYINLHISIVNMPFFGVINLGWGVIPLFTVIISFFSKAYDVSDGVDGLAGGLLIIGLFAFWGIAISSLDTIISAFISFWIGGLISFLYFNVYPARIWLGNSGSLSFGATLAVIGLLLGHTPALLVIGLIFISEALFQFMQITGDKLFKRQLFKVTPLHYWLQNRGWPEPKVTMRLWIIGIIIALIGLWMATF